MDISKEKIEEVVRIGEKYNIDSIGLFGSRARSESNEYSDYDIFIIGDITLDEELFLEGELEDVLEGELDLLKLNGEVDKLLAKNVLNDAKVFIDKKNSFRKFYREIDNFFYENRDFLYIRKRDLISYK